MGTRAAFFIGDIRDVENREWLGCIAYDGYPDGVPEICEAETEKEFRAAVTKYSERDDFAPPDGPFPFPWEDDLCLTDCVYSWFGGEVYCKKYRHWMPLKRALALSDEEAAAIYEDTAGQTLNDIPAPGKPYDGSAPDSIMILGVMPK